MAMARGEGAWGPLTLWGLTVSIITAVLSTWVSFAAIWKAARSRNLANWDTTDWSTGYPLLLWPFYTAACSFLLHRAGRPPALLLLEKKNTQNIRYISLLQREKLWMLIHFCCSGLMSTSQPEQKHPHTAHYRHTVLPVHSASWCFCWQSVQQRGPHYESHGHPVPDCPSPAYQGRMALKSEQPKIKCDFYLEP